MPDQADRLTVGTALTAILISALATNAAADDALDRAVRDAQSAVSESGAAAAATRAKVFAREVCQTIVPSFQDAAAAKSFLDRYDTVQQEREREVSEVRKILRTAPAGDPGRDIVEEGIRMALLLRDARVAVTKCIELQRDSIISAAPETADVGESDERAIDRSSSPGSSEWARYTNARYGFSIEYPHSLFLPAPDASNGDGRAFVARDGSGAEIRVSGSLNLDSKSPEQLRRWLIGTLPGYRNLTYQPIGKDWFVLSGFRGDQIYYDKTIFACGGRVLVTLAMSYPAAQKVAFDPIVNRVVNSILTEPGIDTPDCR